MNRQDVISMALEVGLLDSRDDTVHDDGIAQFIGTLSDFAALAVEKEREACAKVCESIYTNGDGAEGWLEIAAQRIRSAGKEK